MKTRPRAIEGPNSPIAKRDDRLTSGRKLLVQLPYSAIAGDYDEGFRQTLAYDEGFRQKKASWGA